MSLSIMHGHTIRVGPLITHVERIVACHCPVHQHTEFYLPIFTPTSPTVISATADSALVAVGDGKAVDSKSNRCP